MVRFHVAGSNVGIWLVGIGLVVAPAACGGSGTSGGGSSGAPGGSSAGSAAGGTSGSGGGGLGATTSGSSNGAAGGGSGAIANSGAGGGASGSSGSGAAGASGGSGSKSGSGSGGASAGSGATGGGADAGTGGPTLGNCQAGDVTPCGSFTTPTGTTIQLGPYGAQADPNVGKGFENTVSANDPPNDPNQTVCSLFVASFNEDQNLSNELLQTSMNGITIDFSLYSAYRPAIWPSTPVPVISWANGTCAQPEGYGALLRYVASYGYFVIAANSRWVGSGTEQLHALDYAAAANKDPSSPYYGKLDLTKIGIMGHSQGGMSTVAASSD
ncbi:MAG TPA: hypothetical protein VE995_05810, partial [Gaiellaceae bacterium]|nr:hypothetical protein [Gaiellaceae bacterium]